MSKEILSITFNLLQDGNIFVETAANKSLSKHDVYDLIEDYQKKIRKDD